MNARSLFLALLVLVGAVSCNPNNTMEPTILKGEKILANMEPFNPSAGDLVMFDYEGQLLVKRVVGIGGDVVAGRDLQVSVNGKALNEPYVQHTGKRPLGLKTLETFGPVTVPKGKLFVMGDNRDFSFDSRDPRFGLIPIESVKGRPKEIVQSSNPDRIHKTIR